MNEVLTPEEAAAILKVTPRTVYEWLKKGRIPGRKIGKVWRIPGERLERWVRGSEDDVLPSIQHAALTEMQGEPLYLSVPPAPMEFASLEEWEAALDEFGVDLDPSIPPLSDEDLRRENMYEDRW